MMTVDAISFGVVKLFGIVLEVEVILAVDDIGPVEIVLVDKLSV